MHRRSFLSGRFSPQRAPYLAPPGQAGLMPYTGVWSRPVVQHLLKRTMFGSSKADIDYFASLDVHQAVNVLLNPTAPLPAPPVNDYNTATYTDPVVAPGTTWVNNPSADGTTNSYRRASFKKWWTGVMIRQDRSIREKLTLFWANHFGTETTDIVNGNYVYWHHQLLRQNCLGNFKQLVKAVTIDAGMLRYLNGYLNSATAPDENYGRELQELFTLGKASTVQYTEDDVKKAARVLTGWRINNTTFTVYFDANTHDKTNKQFSSYYNNTTITGKTGAAGANETDELLNMIFAKEDVALYICRRLYRWFVYYNIDSFAETNIIVPLAQLFRSANYDIAPVLSALLKSEHFFDAMNRGCFIKSPVDHVIGCLRETNVVFPDVATQYADAYGMYNYIFSWLNSMGQNIGDPPNVSGWPAYYQAPQFHELWINSDTLPKRTRFTDTMIFNGYTRNGKKIIIDAVALVKTLPNPADPNALINDLLAIMYTVPLSATARQTIKQQILLSNQVTDSYWTLAWNAHIANTADVAAYNIVNTRLKQLLQYLAGLPEYQLS